jgi:hypothetical protein
MSSLADGLDVTLTIGELVGSGLELAQPAKTRTAATKQDKRDLFMIPLYLLQLVISVFGKIILEAPAEVNIQASREHPVG